MLDSQISMTRAASKQTGQNIYNLAVQSRDCGANIVSFLKLLFRF